MGETDSAVVRRESLNPGAALTASPYPSCFAHGDIPSSVLLPAGLCVLLDYVPPSQGCGCATRMCPEEWMCSEWLWAPNWEFQHSVSVKYPCSLCKEQTRILVQLSWIQNLGNKLVAGQENKEKVVKEFIWKCQMVQIQFFQAFPSGGWFRNESRSTVWNKRGEWSHPLSS